MINEIVGMMGQLSKTIVSTRHRNDETHYKEDGSPITKTDLMVNDILTEKLVQLMDIPVISEESTNSHGATPETYWIIDPIDGTKEFITGSPDYTVNVALIENGELILSAVSAPDHNLLYWAKKGDGAFCNHSKLPTRRPPKRLSAAVSRSHLDRQTTDLLGAMGIEDILEMGSSLKICRVADGLVNIYPRLAPTMEWDTAAAQLIAEEAGCHVLSWIDLSPLRYGKKNRVNPGFIVCDGEHALPILKQAWSQRVAVAVLEPKFEN